MKKLESPALEYIYQDVKIHFILSNRDNVMINATEMAKAFGKQASDYTKIESTKKFINSLCKDDHFYEIYGVGAEVVPSQERKNKLLEVRSTGKNNGTWMNVVLALEFASWLDSDFKVWIYKTTNNILFGHYKHHWDAHIKQENAKDRMEQSKHKLLLDAKQEDVIAYFEAEKEYKAAKNEKLKAIQSQYRLFENL